MQDDDFDDRPDPAKRLEQARVAAGFKTAKKAADYFSWPYITYTQHESGVRGIQKMADRYARAYKVSEGWLLTGEGVGPSGRESKSLDALASNASPEMRDHIYNLVEQMLKERS